MSSYLVRRLWQMVPILFGVSLGAFAFLQAVPGDPARLLAGPDATLPNVQAVRARLGLDRPLIVRDGYFLRNALVGDFGRSFPSGEAGVGPPLGPPPGFPGAVVPPRQPRGAVPPLWGLARPLFGGSVFSGAPAVGALSAPPSGRGGVVRAWVPPLSPPPFFFFGGVVFPPNCFAA